MIQVEERTIQTQTPFRLVLAISGVVALALLIFWALMNPPAGELRAMALFLSVTALLSTGAGYIVYRLGWLRRSPRLSWTLAGIYALSGLLTFLNVWITARLMFASQHDLILATILLIFAGGIAVVLGYFLSAAVSEQITLLSRAADAVAAGDLTIRVPTDGNDEVARLSRRFNQMTARLLEAERQEQEAQQMRRNLLAWIGHDLRTPLASIQAIVEALADGVVRDRETGMRYLGTARRDIRSLSTLIDQLFDLAQIDAGGLTLDRQSNSLVDLVSDTLESFSAVAEAKGVNLSGSAAPSVDPIWIDAQQIGRVLSNLIGNAIRHTPPGGTVEVKLRTEDEGVLVEVEDDGEGIDPANVPMVFEHFYRAEQSRNRSTGGSGLGLAIAKGLVDAHGGKIGVESHPRQGSRFFFWLPNQPMEKSQRAELLS